MSHHNYTNPAFCQQSEFYPSMNISSAPTTPSGGPTASNAHSRLQRSESRRASFQTKRNILTANRPELPPKPGPKPHTNLSASRYGSMHNTNSSSRYALVPLDELPSPSKNRYTVVNEELVRRTYSKSQETLDIEHSFSEDFQSLPISINHSASEAQPRMKPAFSSDFGGNGSMILVDQKSMQKYTIIPQEANEEIVDDNHEIIQMHNGRQHRYAMIPTQDELLEEESDEQETCLSDNYATITEQNPFQNYSTPPKKNPVATQKLQELLSTPRKTPVKNQPHVQQQYQQQLQLQQQQQQLTPRKQSVHPNTAQRFTSSTPKKHLEFSSVPHPQAAIVPKIVYEEQHLQRHNSGRQSFSEQQRTTAVIQPRLAPSYPDQDVVDVGHDSLHKSWNSVHKVANATATIGAVSLMLILCAAMNSGLCLYMIAHIGRNYIMDVGLISSFAAFSLGILGFRSRQSDWLPNRNYISGFILVTVFSLLKCCGLLVLLALHPIPGTPMHDMTTGIVLGLSSLVLLLISLGVITSRWCRAPPPDNRVDIY